MGGKGSQTYGIYLESNSSTKISNNNIDCGEGEYGGAIYAYCIYIYADTCTPEIESNTLKNIKNKNKMYGIYELTDVIPVKVRNNDFYFSVAVDQVYYRDSIKGDIKDFDTTTIITGEGEATLETWENRSTYS